MEPQMQIADASMAGIKVELENRSLWTEFYQCGTEMIITKPGRRMFPDLRYRISGLDPNQYYIILLDIVPADEYRYKFMGKCWIPAYKSDSLQHKQNLYRHPDSPALGSKWMSQPIGFNKLKLTNSNTSSECHITLNSMHKYVPRLRIFAGSDIAQMSPRKFTTVSFQETTFMAVTAYQNACVTNLKIKNNPFAKGFREDDRRNAGKRVCDQTEELAGVLPLSKRRIQSSSPDVSTTSLSDSPSPTAGVLARPPMMSLAGLQCPPVPMTLSPHAVSSSSSPPTYDFGSASSDVSPTALAMGAANAAPKMAPPTYIDILSRYESMFTGGVGLGALHHAHNAFYGLPNRFLPHQPAGPLQFVSQFNPQLGYPML